jgi:hypothetical protein
MATGGRLEFVSFEIETYPTSLYRISYDVAAGGVDTGGSGHTEKATKGAALPPSTTSFWVVWYESEYMHLRKMGGGNYYQ